MFVNLIIIGIIIIISYYIYQNKCDISLKYILYSLCAIMVIVQLQKIMSKDLGEFFTQADANEAIQNIASIYNNKTNMVVDNLTITGNLDVKGQSTLSGIKNNNGITTDYINTINASSKGQINNDGNAISFINGDTQVQNWQMYNVYGTLRTYPLNSTSTSCVDTSYDPLSKVVKTTWMGPNTTVRQQTA